MCPFDIIYLTIFTHLSEDISICNVLSDHVSHTPDVLIDPDKYRLLSSMIASHDHSINDSTNYHFWGQIEWKYSNIGRRRIFQSSILFVWIG